MFPRIIIPRKNQIILSFVAVFLLVSLAYAPCLKNDFVNWDDDEHLLKNRAVTEFSFDIESLKNIFTATVNKTYIPLTTLSFALEYQIFGEKAFGYHLTNLLLHILVTLLILFFALQCGLSLTAATLAALLFGIHPMHVESVVWITERKDVLYAAFYMLALCSYWKYLQSNKCFNYVFAIIFGIFSILAKPMALSLPLVLVLLDWFYGRRITFKMILEKIPHFFYVIPIAWVTYSLNARSLVENLGEAPLIWIWTFIFYLRQFLLPMGCIPLYPLPRAVSLINFHYCVPVIFFLILLFALYYFRRQRRVIFAFTFYFISIFFLLRFDDAVDTTLVSDRFMYLPSLGFCFLFGIFIERVFLRPDKKNWILRCGRMPLFIVVIFFLMHKTVSQAKIWKNSLSLWSYQLRHVPSTPIALNNLAVYYRQQSDYLDIIKSSNGKNDIKVQEIIGMFQEAIRNDSRYIDAYNNLADTFADVGRYEEARELLFKILELDPKHRDATFNLAGIWAYLGESERAVQGYQKTIVLDPKNDDVYINIIKAYNKMIQENLSSRQVFLKARQETIEQYQDLVNSKRNYAKGYFNLGWAYDEMGDSKRSLAFYQKALAIKPNYANAHYNLGNYYRDKGELDQAIQCFEKVLQFDPSFKDAYLNLGVCFGLKGDNQKALEIYQRAVTLFPDYAEAYFNLGFTHESLGQMLKAIEAYRKAIALDPRGAEFFYNLGNTLVNVKNDSEAIAAYQAAISNDPKHLNALVNLSLTCFRNKLFEEALEYCLRAQALGYQPPQEYINALQTKNTQGQ